MFASPNITSWINNYKKGEEKYQQQQQQQKNRKTERKVFIDSVFLLFIFCVNVDDNKKTFGYHFRQWTMKINTNHSLRDMIWNSFEMLRPITHSYTTHIHERRTMNGKTRICTECDEKFVFTLFHFFLFKFVPILFPLIFELHKASDKSDILKQQWQNSMNKKGGRDW